MRERFKSSLRAIGKNDVELFHIFLRLAVFERALAAGVIRDDAAHRGYLAAGGGGGEHQPLLHRRLLKVPIKYPRFCHRVSCDITWRAHTQTSWVSRRQVDFAPMVHMLGEGDHDAG